MLEQNRTDTFLVGAFATIVLTIVGVSVGSGLSTFAGLLGFFFFVYLWLISGLDDASGESTRA
jgi:hypothetical protein